MKYLVEFKDLPRSVATALLINCSCDQCARSDRKIAKQSARGAQLEALLAERRASCKSDGILPSGTLRIWLGKWQILNFTGKNRLPYFTF